MLRKTIAVLSLVAGGIALRAQDSPAPPELVKFVMDARKLQVKDTDIRDKALSAGWPTEIVVKAMVTAGTDGARPSEPAKAQPPASPPPDQPKPSTQAKPVDVTQEPGSAKPASGLP